MVRVLLLMLPFRSEARSETGLDRLLLLVRRRVGVSPGLVCHFLQELLEARGGLGLGLGL